MNTTALSVPAARGSVRRILLTVHLWIGVMLGIPLVLIGLTGSVLVFEDELRDLFSPQPQAVRGEARSLSAILAAAQAAAPDGMRPLFLAAPEEPGKMSSVRFAKPGAPPGPGGTQILVDPVSLQTSALPPNGGWLRQMFNLHAQLFVPGRDGRWLVGWFGVAMCVLGISGLIMWWPRRANWQAAFQVNPKACGARFFRELHGAVGIWCWVVFMAVSVSSVYLAYPQTVGDIVRSILPARDLRLTAVPRAEPIDGMRPIGPDEAVALAAGAVPDGKLRFVALPQRPDQAIRVNMGGPEYRHGTPMISVFVDPWAKRVVEVRDPREYTAGETALAWMHAIHAGNGFGWPWRILVFLSGLLPSVFVGSGVTLWLLSHRRA